MKRYEPTKMRLLYEQWRESNRPKAEFAAMHNISAHTFYYWAKKFEESAEGGSSSGFQAIGMVGSFNRAVTVVRYPSGAQIEFYTPVEAAYLKALVN